MAFNPQRYWNKRYEEGRDSGEGSRGDAAVAKAKHVNNVIKRYSIVSVVDWGCGDGQVLSRITEDVDYTGVDISRVVVDRVRREHPGRFVIHTSEATDVRADMALSLDVLFHLPNDLDYRQHLAAVFKSARRIVLIHATDHNGGRTANHVFWRRWTHDVPRGWRIVRKPTDPTEIGFYLCERA